MKFHNCYYNAIFDKYDKVAEVLLNLNNSDPENRRLARFDYAKMNLTAAIALEQVELEVRIFQKNLEESIDFYEYKVRRLEGFIKNLNLLDFDWSHKERQGKNGLGLE